MRFRKYLPKFLVRKKVSALSNEEIEFIGKVNKIVGFNIQNPDLYREAFSLKIPSEKNRKNYERLEFLGDAVLGSIISCYLYITYPNANEGYMTQMKSKIVNRKNLNKLGEELGLVQLLHHDKNATLSENISGNIFEALIGAIFLDVDYETCKKTVLERLLTPTEINKLENKIVSYKSLLLEWSQKKKNVLRYETVEEDLPNKTPSFRSFVWLDDAKIANASAASKKKAEEKAAQRAFYILNKKQNILEKPKTIS